MGPSSNMIGYSPYFQTFFSFENECNILAYAFNDEENSFITLAIGVDVINLSSSPIALNLLQNKLECVPVWPWLICESKIGAYQIGTF